jgi:hypothetical protein
MQIAQFTVPATALQLKEMTSIPRDNGVESATTGL